MFTHAAICSIVTRLIFASNKYVHSSIQLLTVTNDLFFSHPFCLLSRLSVLSLGGNLLTEVPDAVGRLQQLQALTLCDNLIEVLPASIARLTNLKSLLIHKNRLRHLPRDIIALKNLVEVSGKFPNHNNNNETKTGCRARIVWMMVINFNHFFLFLQLSLRENPLVVRFVQEISLHPPSLLELAARVIRTSSIPFEPHEVPRTLRDYLNTAHHCVNPKCKGEFWSN